MTTARGEGHYRIYGVAGNRVVESRNNRKPPSDAYMVEWGKERGCYFVLRYWPSKKGWMVLDIRNAQFFNRSYGSRTFPQAVGHIRGTRIWPSSDAAIMHLMAIMSGTQGRLL